MKYPRCKTLQKNENRNDWSNFKRRLKDKSSSFRVTKKNQKWLKFWPKNDTLATKYVSTVIIYKNVVFLSFVGFLSYFFVGCRFFWKKIVGFCNTTCDLSLELHLKFSSELLYESTDSKSSSSSNRSRALRQVRILGVTFNLKIIFGLLWVVRVSR